MFSSRESIEMRKFGLVVVIFLLLSSISQYAEAKYFAPSDQDTISRTEDVVELNFSGGHVRDVQELLDRVDTRSSDKVIFLTITGKVKVAGEPLRFGSRTWVDFAEGSSVEDGEKATAAALISIENAEYVNLSGSGLDRTVVDGMARAKNGIRVTDSGVVNIDHFDFRNFTEDAVVYKGRGKERLTDGGSLTRSRFSNSGNTGLSVADAAQFVCLDNQFVNLPSGLEIISFRSIVAGNFFQGNEAGITIGSPDSVITDNEFNDNRKAVVFREEASDNLLTYNQISGNELGIAVNGRYNKIYFNSMRNGRQFSLKGKENVIASNRGVKPEDALDENNLYFNPPTISNNHDDEIIAAGLGRHDITVQGFDTRGFHDLRAGQRAHDLAKVQQAIDKARKEHPNDFLVVHVKGLFEHRHGATGLDIPGNTSVIVYNEIQSDVDKKDPDFYVNVDLDGRRDTQLILMAGRGFNSLSGGMLDAKYEPYHAVRIPGKNIAVIDGVTIKKAGFNSITTVGHGGRAQPLFIRGCTVVDSGNRGIWTHVTRNIHVIDNVCSGNISDGIDIDAYCSHSNFLFNVSTGNYRDGIFVEEAAQNNLMFANVLNNNWSRGIALTNAVVTGGTSNNVSVANRLEENGHGITVGGRDATRRVDDNFIFNNQIGRNRNFGVSFGNKTSRKGNLFSRNVFYENQKGPVKIVSDQDVVWD